MKKFWFLGLLFFLFLVSCDQESIKEEPIKEDVVVEENKIEYVEVTFLDYDDTLLYKETIEKGKDIVYPYENPKRESDEEYSYTFTGWDNKLVHIGSNLVIHALYEKTAIWGNIIWFD